MADESETNDTEAEGEAAPDKKGSSPIPFLIVGVLAVGLGLALPFVLPLEGGVAKDDSDPGFDHVEEIAEDLATYVPFTEDGDGIVVNLDGERMTRYLRIAFSMKIAKESEDEFRAKLAEKMPPLRDWLINHLSVYSLEEIRGAAGQNRIRREIRDQFNTIMFPKGGDRIFEILFFEFAVQ